MFEYPIICVVSNIIFPPWTFFISLNHCHSYDMVFLHLRSANVIFSNSWRSNRSSYSLFKNLLAKIGWLVNLEANGGDFCILRFPEGYLLPTESVDKEQWGPGSPWVNINVHRRKIVSFTCHRSYTSCTVLIQGRSATVIPMALYGAKIPWLNSNF
jgi:hypothetical protein